MVYINSTKYACEACIKGHRSSGCRHNDRPLFEIKKKGRPVSQCDKCRVLRQTKKVHGKCMCQEAGGCADAGPSLAQAELAPLPKPKGRFVPIAPALPNGLKDAMLSTALPPADPRQTVDSLLNPCRCKSVWKCQCRPGSAPLAVALAPSSGLTALAQAAALCCRDIPAPPAATASKKRTQSGRRTPPRGPSSRGASPEPEMDVPKRAKIASHAKPSSCCTPAPVLAPSRGPDLPPLRFGHKHGHGFDFDGADAPFPSFFSSSSDASSSSLDTSAPPLFPTIPPLSAIASLAGSGCGCGFECACPGCVEHRGPAHAHAAHSTGRAHGDCPDACATCVDRASGIAGELPEASPFGVRMDMGGAAGRPGPAGAGTSVIDLFFARAAALPSPPLRRRGLGASLDLGPGLGDVDMFAGDVPAGAQRLPKLVCCAGACGCAGACTCGGACDGRCGRHRASADREAAAPALLVEAGEGRGDVVTAPTPASCCAA